MLVELSGRRLANSVFDYCIVNFALRFGFIVEKNLAAISQEKIRNSLMLPSLTF
jgi:hypothetical protein